VTIKQLLDCEEAYPDAELAIDGAPIHQVTFVGQVRAIQPQTTNITYRLDDGTAIIDVKKWVDAEKVDDGDPKFAVDQYVRVWGRFKPFNNKKMVSALFIRAVDDYNEVNYHLLEATYVHLYFTKGLPAQHRGGDTAAAAAGDGGDSMFVDQYGGGGGGGPSKLDGCSRGAQTVYNFLQNTPGGNEGVHLNTILNGTHMPARDVIAAADELLTQGLVYTTIDDETWAILDY
jgi:replication factor A2